MSTSKRQRELARIYVHGPDDDDGTWNQKSEEFRWREACKIVGYSRPGSIRNNEKIKELIAKERGDQDEDQVQRVLDTVDPETKDWKTLAESLIPLYTQIATGALKARPAQVRALDNIMTRGLGRPVDKAKGDRPSSVVVLPVLGHGDEPDTFVCPKCYTEYTGQDIKDYFHV